MCQRVLGLDRIERSGRRTLARQQRKGLVFGQRAPGVAGAVIDADGAHGGGLAADCCDDEDEEEQQEEQPL